MVHIAFFILGFMIKYFLLTFFMMAGSCYAQSFPYSFVGQWKGELQWFQTGKQEPQKIPMQLKILPADTVGQFTWQLVYGMNNEDNRPYILKPVDTVKGHWVIDEKKTVLCWTSILLANVFMGLLLYKQPQSLTVIGWRVINFSLNFIVYRQSLLVKQAVVVQMFRLLIVMHSKVFKKLYCIRSTTTAINGYTITMLYGCSFTYLCQNFDQTNEIYFIWSACFKPGSMLSKQR